MDQVEGLRRLVAAEHGLAVVATSRADGSMQCSVVNAGVLDHPRGGRPVVGFVTGGGSVKLRNLRQRPTASVVFRSGWEWATVEGGVTLIGPQDPAEGATAEDLRQLLRDVFTAAGGTHDDWDEFDRVMEAEGRTAVLVELDRVYSN